MANVEDVYYHKLFSHGRMPLNMLEHRLIKSR